jgi:hypothetical protein
MTDTSGPLLPPRVDEGYYTSYRSPNVFGRESARFAGEALEAARQSAAAAGESPGAYLPNIAMSGLNLADAGLRYGIGAFSELLGGTPAQESRLMREIYGMPEAFAGSGFIRGASALDDLLEASTANRALRNEMGLADFRARTAGFTPDAPRPVNYYVPTPDELARMEADSTPAQADYLLRRREALALKNEGVSNEEIFAETGIDFIPVRGADGELMDEIPALPTGPSQVNIDRLQELFAQGEGASAPLSEIVLPNETLMGLRGEIPGRVEITSSGPGVGSFDRKTGTIRINPNRATPEMVEDVFRHENVHGIMRSGGSARTLGGANALSEADLTQQYLGLARTARADARARLESGEITQDQFDEIDRRISAAEEGMLVTPSERYTRDIGELLAREAMDPQFGTMSVALTPSEALNPLIRPNVGLIQRADQAASAALLPYRRLARIDEAINRGISTLSAPLSRFFPDEKPRTPAAMLSTLRTQPTAPVPQSRAMARESFSTISPSDIVSEVAAGGRRNAPRYMTLPSEDLMAADFDPEAMIRALREGVPAAEARLADDMRIGNERIRAESLARMGEEVTPPALTPDEELAAIMRRIEERERQNLIDAAQRDIDRFSANASSSNTPEDFGYYQDNPALKFSDGEEWLRGKQESAEASYSNRRGITGSITGTLGSREQDMFLPTSFLRRIPGLQNERRVPGDPQYDALMRDARERGFLPDQGDNKIVLAINHRGEPFIVEGNTRTAVAGDLGIPNVRVEVRYWNGGEMVDGPFSPENISRIAARGPREFARGGEVMMRSDMSSQLSGGIGGFAGDAKNMFRGPRGIGRYAQYMQDGGEITARGLGASQGSTTGSAVAGPGRDVYTGFDGDRLSAVRTRIIRESGVDPVRIAAEEGLDPNLFLNMIAQESGGNARAQSDAGAYGYTQLMDATARELGVDRTDPEQNLRGGARYLRQQIDTFEDIPLALAAYNAGPGAVRRYGGIPPFAETRAYVANILGLPGGQMAVSPTMRPEAVMPVPRPAEQDRFYSGLLPQRNPLNELGEILVSRPANQIAAGQLPQLDQTLNASIMPDQLGGFTDLMRTMP